jgi:hypothetical protein
MKKMLRSGDYTAMRRLLTLLYRTFAAADPRATGLVSYIDADNTLREECPDLDSTHITSLLRAFQDKTSDCVYYPELLCFLNNCSIKGKFLCSYNTVLIYIYISNDSFINCLYFLP